MHGRDHNDRDVAVVRAQPGEQLQAVHLRHDHVAEHQIHGMITQQVERLAAISNGDTLVALSLQQSRDNFPDGFFVVGYQNVIVGHAGPRPITPT